MAVEVEPAMVMKRGAMAPWSLAPPPQEALRRCTRCASEKTPQWRPGPDGPGTLCNACWHWFTSRGLLHSKPRRHPSNKHPPCMNCASEKTRRWLRGPDGPGTLCNPCGQQFLKRGLLDANSHRHRARPSSSKDDSAANNNVAALAEALPCHVGASLDAIFDHTGSELPRGEAGAERANEEGLELLSNKDAFPSVVETVAVVGMEEEASAPDVPRAKTKGRRRVTVMEMSFRQANGDLRAEKETLRRCTHCAMEKTSYWREGPEGPRTLCNACGAVFKKKGRLLPEYRPANSPAFSPLLHSNRYSRALEMHQRNKTSATGEMHVKLMNPPENGPTSSPPAEKETVWRCTRCGTEKTPQLCEGPEGPRTLCNVCGVVFKKKGLLLPEDRPANNPALSPLLHSNKYSRSLKIHHQNETSATGEMHAELMVSPENGPTSSPPAKKETVRRCTCCATEKTPQWRMGPEGPGTLCNACGVVFKKGRLLPEYRPVNSPSFSPLLHSNRYRRALEMHRRNETSATGEMQVELMDPPANGLSSSPLERYSSLRRVLEEEISAAGQVVAAEAHFGEESMKVQQPLQKRPSADRPAFSLVYHRRMLKHRRKSEEETFASIHATAKGQRADRAAACLAAMDN